MLPLETETETETETERLRPVKGENERDKRNMCNKKQDKSQDSVFLSSRPSLLVE